MPSKFGGVSVDTGGGSRFGGVAVSPEPIEEPAQVPQKRKGLGRSARGAQLSDERIAEREKFLSSLSPERRSLIESISPMEAMAIGAGQGFTTIGRGVGLADQATPDEKQAFEQLKTARPSTGVGQVVAEAAPFVLPGLGVGGIASLPARAAATAALGATEGGIITKGEGGDIEDAIKGAGIGGAVAGGIELALPVIGRIGGKLIRKVTGKRPTSSIITPDGAPTPEFQKALKSEGITFDDVVAEASEQLGNVDPRQAARKSFLESQGLKPTKAQVTRGASDFQAQQEAAKPSSSVRAALEDQEQILSTRFDNVVKGSGGDVTTETNTVVDSLTNKATRLDKEISGLYKKAREVVSQEKGVKFNGLTKKLRELAPSDRRAGGNVEAVVGDLQAKGVLDKDMNVVGRVSVETAEDVRQLTNELFDPQNSFGNGVLRQIKESLDDDVFKAAGEDVFKQARKAKTDFERGLTRAKISKFDSRKKNLVRDVLENKISPDELTDKVVFGKTWRDTDLQQLKDYITTEGDGVEAFNDMRSQVLQSIKEKAFIGAEDGSGLKAMSADKIEKAVKSIGDKKLNILFKPGEVKFLKDMVRVSKLREPVRGTALGRGPSAQAVGKLQKAVESIPFAGSLIESVAQDAQGNIILKASTKLKDITPPSQARQLGAQLGAIGAVSATQEQEK